MRAITREGYSKSFEFDRPDYFSDQEGFEEIGDGIYKTEVRDESAIIIYNEASNTIDIVGEFQAVRGIQWSHRQEFGADAGFNNGVGKHYSPEGPIESKAAREALQEFGVETQGLEQDQKERPKVAADGGRPQTFPGQEEYAQLGNEHFEGEEASGYGPSR
ncbi:MAG: hypothetical protein ABEJ87_03275 [Candidatus Nanohalobium sp.]